MERETTEIYLVGDRDTVTGFQLAGVKNSYVIEDMEPARIYEELSDKLGIIMVTYEAAKKMGGYLDKLEEKTVVFVLPDKEGKGDETINKLIKKAIGFDITK